MGRTATRVAPVSNVSRGVIGRGWFALFASTLMMLAMLALAGCGSAVTVKAAYDPAAPFGQYRTFAMLEPNRAVPTGMDSDPFTAQQLRQFTYQALVAHGLRPVTVDQADVVVGVLTRMQEKIEIDGSGGPYTGAYDYRYYGYGPRYGGPWAGFGTTFGPTVSKYDEVQVAIDLIDPKANEVRWRGYGARRADRKLSGDQVREIVDRILSQYPPGQKK